MAFQTKFTSLGHPNKIWVVPAVHGEAMRLAAIHKAVYEKFIPGDRLVYTGNYLAKKPPAAAVALDTLGELLHFRRALLARPGVQAADIAYLRGIQEELWSKLLQLPFAPDAGGVVDWMAKRHPEIDCLLGAYGSSFAETARIAREGILSLTRWSTALKSRIRAVPGHEQFFTGLRLAAFTELRGSNDNNLLFVHAGLDPSRPLTRQGDSFWWGSRGFNRLSGPCKPFRAVIRGFDPEAGGLHLGAAVMSLDDGAGRGGRLICARLSNTGEIQEILSA